MSTKHIDKKQLTSILKLDYKEMVEIVNDIFDSIPESVAQLKILIATNDRSEIAFLAHSLNGETANFGLTSLSKLFTRLEDLADKLSPEEVEKILNEVLNVNKSSLLEFKQEYLKSN